MNIRTETETRILREEAERLARMHWPRTHIARTLGVSLHTLARWAYAGGWRQKDIAAEGEAERIAAIHEQIAARRAQEGRAHEARLACGRLAPSAGMLEYKSRDYRAPLPGDPGYIAPPDADPAPDLRYPSENPDYGPWEPTETLPKFLTRGGPRDEQVRWAAPQMWARTPPWAPGNEIEHTEHASLHLAEDLMRQGLLTEAQRALRWTKAWLEVSQMVSDRDDAAQAAHQAFLDQQEEERAREKARCKALGLPDPDDVLNAQLARMSAQIGAHIAKANDRNTATPQQSSNGKKGRQHGVGPKR